MTIWRRSVWSVHILAMSSNVSFFWHFTLSRTNSVFGVSLNFWDVATYFVSKIIMLLLNDNVYVEK